MLRLKQLSGPVLMLKILTSIVSMAIDPSLKRPRANPILEKNLGLKSLRSSFKKLSQQLFKQQHLRCLRLKRKRKKIATTVAKSVAKNKEPRKAPTQLPD